jgi:hypothetical protein
MRLWCEWWRWCAPLRKACARNRTFVWMGVVLVGFCVREDLWGVTSLVRALGLQAACYDRLLDFFHSPALNVEMLTRLWAALVVNLHPGLLRCNGRLVLVGDGIKIGKAGKKMPGVKRLHQESESNTKPEYILGHSCQAVAILAQNLSSTVAIPLAARIHEGVVFSNRDQRTLLDKMVQLLGALALDALSYYFVADAYFASRKIALPLLRLGQHLVTRVRNNAVGYLPAPAPERRKRGRPRVYGEKCRLKSLFDDPNTMQTLESPVYGESGVQLDVWTRDLLWRPVGILVRFVAVLHPTRGRLMLMTTDLALAPLDVIRLYGYRFKIEVSFKSALHVLGAFLYHFWMAGMTPITRKARNQYLHRKTDAYRDAVRRKLAAYHRFIQLGLIAQGIMLALATTVPHLVWASFGSWLRTIRPGICPSEAVVAIALRNTLPHFLADSSPAPDLAKFIQERLDFDQNKARRLAA